MPDEKKPTDTTAAATTTASEASVGSASAPAATTSATPPTETPQSEGSALGSATGEASQTKVKVISEEEIYDHDLEAGQPALYLPTETDIKLASNQHGTHNLGDAATFFTTKVNEDKTVNGMAVLDGATIWIKGARVVDRHTKQPGAVIAQF